MGPPVAASRDSGSNGERFVRPREPAARDSDTSCADCILCERRCGLASHAPSWGGGLYYFVLKSGGAGGARTFEAAGRAVFPRRGGGDGPAQRGNRKRAVGTGR